MNTSSTFSGPEIDHSEAPAVSTVRSKKTAPTPFRFTNYDVQEESTYRQAELFYLQKQIQSQTQMVIVLADGERIEGVIEWYDRRALKVRGREKVLVYKSAIKYMYKYGENMQ